MEEDRPADERGEAPTAAGRSRKFELAIHHLIGRRESFRYICEEFAEPALALSRVDKMPNRRREAAGAVALSMIAGPAFAADVADALSVGRGWRFEVSDHGWATATNGDFGIRSLPAAIADLSAWDAIRSLDAVSAAGSILVADGMMEVLGGCL